MRSLPGSTTPVRSSARPITTSDQPFFSFGWLRSDGTFTTFFGAELPPRPPPPFDRYSITLNGINDAGEIVGVSNDPSLPEAFMLRDGTFLPLEVPDGAHFSPNGINDSGQIVGSNGVLIGDGSFVTIEVPGANSTRSYGINDSGWIVGAYFADGVQHGFLARPIPEPSTLALFGFGTLALASLRRAGSRSFACCSTTRTGRRRAVEPFRCSASAASHQARSPAASDEAGDVPSAPCRGDRAPARDAPEPARRHGAAAGSSSASTASRADTRIARWQRRVRPALAPRLRRLPPRPRCSVAPRGERAPHAGARDRLARGRTAHRIVLYRGSAAPATLASARRRPWRSSRLVARAATPSLRAPARRAGAGCRGRRPRSRDHRRAASRGRPGSGAGGRHP